MGGGKQYGGLESWDPQGREGGDQYRAWNDHNQGTSAQYTDMRSTWEGREGSYSENHYPTTLACEPSNASLRAASGNL
jgi:hypothetical protein